MKYKQKVSPLIYGILYSERVGNTVETTWYETLVEREEAAEHILKTGQLDVRSYGSPIGKTVNVYAFSKIDADKDYYALETQSFFGQGETEPIKPFNDLLSNNKSKCPNEGKPCYCTGACMGYQSTSDPNNYKAYCLSLNEILPTY